MDEQRVIARDVMTLAFAALVLIGVAATELYSYLLFHSLAEMFSIAVACGIFMVVWNARRFVDNSYLLFIGIAYLFVGGVDLVHTLAFKGMGVFSGYGSDLTVQLWIVARYVEGISLLIAPLLIRRKLNVSAVFVAYALAVFVLFLSVFYWQVFPTCYVEGPGLTPFKKISEYSICVILLGAASLLVHYRREFDAHVLRLLLLSIAFTIASELAFTLYASLYDLLNMLGHLLKIVSFYLIYKAVIEASLVQPYRTLFRDLKQSEEALRVNELRFRMIMDESPDGVVVVNRQGVVRYMNLAAEALFGMKASELVDQPFGFPVEAGKTTELDIPRRDAGTATVRMRVVETVWESEPGYLATLHDITDRKPNNASAAGQTQ